MLKKFKVYFTYLLNYLKDIWFFIYTKKDLKLDFPLPPKPFYRLFKIVFWKRFFPHYRRRKKSELKFSNIKEYWSKEQWKQDDYLNWLVKTFEKQYPTVTSDYIFKKYYDLKISKILEVGCGSGHSAACLLSYFINQSYIKKDSFDDLNHIEYAGVDLSETRIKTANLFLPVFLNKFKDSIKLNFFAGDAKELDFKDNYFDFCFIPSVFERVDEKNIEGLIKEICRVSKQGIFVSDFYDQMPDGYPRSPKELSKYFNKFDFKLSYSKENYVKTKKGEHCEIHILFESK